MKVVLINPVARVTEGYHTIGTKIPHLGLQVLAKIMMPHHEVEIIDEIFGTAETTRLIEQGNYDLVGLTSYTSTVTRAYELAEFCREKSIPVIMGGPHVSARPEEAAQHVDCVAIGECDEIWLDILSDAQAGKLKNRYEGFYADLTKGYGGAAQELQPINGKYDVACIQTARGCPIGCEYCSVTWYNGKNIRRRPVDDIVKEWNSTTKKFIFVVDDNFYGVGPQHAKDAQKLLQAIVDKGKKKLWFSQTSLNMGGDPEGLKLAYKAGCRAMLVGIESFNPETLKQWGKGLNRKLLDEYKTYVDGYHKAGLAVLGGFVIGSDQDTIDSASATLLKAVQLGVDIIQITNITPLPGTKLFDNWLRTGKLRAKNFPEDWERYTFVETVYNPVKMTYKNLDESIFELRKAAKSKMWVIKRTLKTFWLTKSITTALFVHGMNWAWSNLAKGLYQRDEKKFSYLETPPARWAVLKQSLKLFAGKFIP